MLVEEYSIIDTWKKKLMFKAGPKPSFYKKPRPKVELEKVCFCDLPMWSYTFLTACVKRTETDTEFGISMFIIASKALKD